MSLVFDSSREVSVGHTVGFQGGGGSSSAPNAYVSNKHRLSLSSSSSSSSSSNEEEITRISCFSVDPDLSSDNSSVDGFDDSEDDDENEAGSKNLNGALSSMDSLEDSLPIKRGLSNYFTGKSKSFGNLSEVTTVNSLVKTENPFNKRRRTLIAYKLSRSRNFYSSANPISMPLLTLHEDEDYQQEQEDEESDSDRNNKDDESEEDSDSSTSYVSNRNHRERKIKSYKPTRSFSLTDLHENVCD
ncbi:hypothetical protein MKW98_012691 [Papaver atlanticum]|uniref:Uncharacterized protein n=1 Tax=Papaver atlanticum TaxID=357466 RepID=A0AAD4T0A0_9MAGN|nr:hypothetical protein MKW98_012691 [Papaver atlanticum]